MQKFARFLHIVGTAGFLGSVAVLLVLTGRPPPADPGQAVALRETALWVARHVTAPAFVLTWVAGLLSMAVQPGFLGMRWVWAKFLVGPVAGGLLMFAAIPTLERSRALAARTESGEDIGDLLAQAVSAEASWWWALLALNLLATALGTWRPRLLGEARPKD
jgi:hypothetical protein